MSKKTSDSFQKNYTALEEIYNKLRSENVSDIDELLPMIKQATKAYESCKKRIEQVDKALQEHLAAKTDEE